MNKSIINYQTKQLLETVSVAIFIVSLVIVGVGCYLCATSFSDNHPVLTALFFAQALFLSPFAIYIADNADYEYHHDKKGNIVIHFNEY